MGDFVIAIHKLESELAAVQQRPILNSTTKMGEELRRLADCDEAVRRIGAKHGPAIEALWQQDLARRRARVAAVELSRVPPLALASTLRRFRRERGLTQQQLGCLVGHSRAHITKIESGTVPLANGTFARILQALGADAAEVKAQALAGKGAPDSPHAFRQGARTVLLKSAHS